MRRAEVAAVWQRLRQALVTRRRERLMPLAAGALFLLLWVWLTVPAQRWLAAQREAHRAAIALQERVMALPAQRDTDTTDTPHVMAQPLMALVNETSPAFGLAFGDFRPEGETRLALDLRGGEFDALLRWLALLEQRHGIRVSGMEVRPTDTPGQVDAGVVVERRAPGEGGWP